MNCTRWQKAWLARLWFRRARRCEAHAPVCLAASALIVLAARGLLAQEAEIPVVKADLGSCTVDFTVADQLKKPLYNAKIRAVIRHGFLSKRKLELEVGTNSDGKARFEGLPNRSRRPLEFLVSFEDAKKSVWHDPAENCAASFNVVLESE